MDLNLTQKLRQKMASRSRIRGRYNSSELYFILTGKTTPEEWMRPKEKSTKELLTMWSGIGLHNQIQSLLGGKDYKEEKVEFEYKGMTIVAKADFMPPHKKDEVWEFKTSDKVMSKAKPWQEHQVKLYCTMFGKENGTIYQPLQDADGIYLKNLGTVKRDDEWFNSELEKLYIFHQKVEKLWIASSRVL